jgi:hypothetical protein
MTIWKENTPQLSSFYLPWCGVKFLTLKKLIFNNYSVTVTVPKY